MNKKSWQLKFFVVLFVLLNAMIFSGVELAFCDDSVQESSSQPCVTCLSNLSTAVLNQSLSVSPGLSESLLPMERFIVPAPVPSLNPFRPPKLA